MVTEVQTSQHYDGKINIKFFPNSHRYQLEGERTYLVGVTTATGQLDKSRPLLIWASRLTEGYLNEILKSKVIEPEDIATACNQHNVKREEAATSGTLVHEWAEAYIKNQDPDIPEDEEVRNGVLAFMKWVSENGVRFIASEKRVYSRAHKYVGTMDCIFTMEKDFHKVVHAGDFKTSSGIYMEAAMQLSAYQHAEAEEHGTEYGSKYVLKFDKKTGEFEAKEFTVEEHRDHFEGFLACLKLKELSKVWDKTHGYYSGNKKT